MAKLYIDLEGSLIIRSMEELKEMREELISNCAELLCAADSDNIDLLSETGSNILYVCHLFEEMKELKE